MRTVKISFIMGIVLFLAVLLEAEPVGTEFTYQGRLIDVNSAVGLGTTIPDRNLDIYHSNSGGGIEIDRSLNTIWSGIVYENNGAENWFIGVQANSDDLLFKDNKAGISMVIEDGTGYVGIGTTDPAYRLDFEGTVQAHAFDTGDIFLRKDGRRLWRIFEDEAGLYLENLRTSKVYTFVLQTIQEENETKSVIDFGVVIDELKAENKSLKQRIEALETVVQQLVEGSKFEL